MKKNLFSRRGIRLQSLLYVLILVASIFSAASLIISQNLRRTSRELAQTTQDYIAYRDIIEEMWTASNYLTDQARAFATIGDMAFVDNYFTEKEVTKRRERALELLGAADSEGNITDALSKALESSHILEQTELYSMRLVIESNHQNVSDYPEALGLITLLPEDQEASAYDKWHKASTITHDNAYEYARQLVQSYVTKGETFLSDETMKREVVLAQTLSRLINIHSGLTGGIVLMTVILALTLIFLLILPLRTAMSSIQNHERIPLRGAYELKTVSSVYNEVFRENTDIRDKLAYEASHDSLTGLYNRRIFDEIRGAADYRNSGMILADVDYFKSINDQYGHDVGDRVLQRTAQILKSHFRAADLVCRIGGDEFAVILKDLEIENTGFVEKKLQKIQAALAQAEGSIPPVTLSIGVAFYTAEEESRDLFKAADVALYQAKARGRNGYVIQGR